MFRRSIALLVCLGTFRLSKCRDLIELAPDSLRLMPGIAPGRYFRLRQFQVKSSANINEARDATWLIYIRSANVFSILRNRRMPTHSKPVTTTVLKATVGQ